MQRAKFDVLAVTRDEVVIRDTGRGLAPTVTNAVEGVVADLRAQKLLPPGRRLFYYDNEGALDEILLVGGVFAGFAPGPRRG